MSKKIFLRRSQAQTNDMTGYTEVFRFLNISPELLRPYTMKDVTKFLEGQPKLINSLQLMMKAERDMKKFYALQGIYNQKKMTNLSMGKKYYDDVMEGMVKHVESQKKTIHVKRQKIKSLIYVKFLK